MACPTCDHSLSPIGDSVFHCPRCGTLKWANGRAGTEYEFATVVPMLVQQCRDFRVTRHPSFKARVGIFGDPVLSEEWHRSGIAESINLPEVRQI